MKLNVRQLAGILLVLVVALSTPAAVQAIAVQHNGYRIAGQYLTGVSGGQSVLAQAQLALGFYQPADFAPISQASLSGHKYLVVDFVATENGYASTIQQLTREGRLRLVATIPADLPPEVYLDWISFSQLGQWNYTYIQVYQITNST